MKKLIILFTFSITLCLMSCRTDEGCFADSVAGTYTGTIECDEENPIAITFEVVAGTSDIQVIIDGIPTTIEECDLYGSNVFQGTGREIDGDFDGDDVHFLETHRINGEVDFRCLWRAVKQ